MRVSQSIADRWSDLCQWVAYRRADVVFRTSQWSANTQTPLWIVRARRACRAAGAFVSWRWELWRARRIDPIAEWALVFAASAAEWLHRGLVRALDRAQPWLDRFSRWAISKAEALRNRRSEVLWRWRSFSAHRIEPVVHALEDRMQAGPGPLRHLVASDLVPGRRTIFTLLLVVGMFALSWWNSRPTLTPEATPEEISLLQAFTSGATTNPNADYTKVTPRSLKR